jgi:hypothetical protein
MNIPFVPKEPLVDGNGYVSQVWRRYFNSLSSELQKHVSDEGYYTPRQTTATVEKLSNDKSRGGLLYDSDKELIHINNDGKYHPVQTTKQKMTTSERNAVPSDKRDYLMVHDTDNSKLYTGINGSWKEVKLA